MLKFIITAFITWKIWTVLFLLLAIAFVAPRLNFLGGGFEHYINNTWFWAWGNFDGEHYLSIAQKGYGDGEQAFFPLYPLLMRLTVWFSSNNLLFLQVSGLIISHVSLFLALIGLWKLVKLDYQENIAKFTIILLLVFPASFYFGSVYTESLFLALAIWSFLAARRGHWWEAGILGGLATASRFVGIILLPALLIELVQQRSKLKNKFILHTSYFILLACSGLLFYMYYLNQTIGDPLAFWHSLSYFGEQRSAAPILLPQVFWRYIKIFSNVDIFNPFFFTLVLEALTAVIFFILAIFSLFKLRFSYAIFLFLGFLIPTLSGSFSSLPRYVIVLFPAFLLMAIFFDKFSLKLKLVTSGTLFIVLGVSTIFFVRGYWIA